MKKKLTFFLLSLAAFVVLFAVMVMDYPADKPKPLLEVSVVVPYQSSDEFATIRQGLDQAADDLNVEVRYLTLTKRYDTEEQQTILRRELEGRADGVILFPTDSIALAPIVEEWFRKVPIVTIESPVVTDKPVPAICGNDYDMGLKLAERVLAYRQDNSPVYLLYSNPKSLSLTQRAAGISDAFQEDGLTVFQQVLPPELPLLQQELARMAQEQPGIWIALEPLILEQAAQLAHPSVMLYGMGSSNLIASGLEEGRIEATVVKNDFSEGYLAMGLVVGNRKNTTVPQNPLVEFQVVDCNNMYDREIQKLLFPFVR